MGTTASSGLSRALDQRRQYRVFTQGFLDTAAGPSFALRDATDLVTCQPYQNKKVSRAVGRLAE